MEEEPNIIVKFQHKYLTIKNENFVQAFAEFFGTFVLVTMVNFGIAMGVLGGTGNNAVVQIALSNGLGLMLAVYLSGGISGGHVNPAVSFGFLSVGKMCIGKFLMYNIAQYLGGFLGAALAYLQYHEIILDYANGSLLVPPEPLATAQIFGTFPNEQISTYIAFFDQIIGTGTLVMAIFSYVDPRNAGVTDALRPLLIGLTLVMLITSTGMLTQTSLNPARDLPPRLLTLMVGYPLDVFSTRNYTWFLAAWFGPYIGGAVGAWTYEIFFGLPLEHREQEKQKSKIYQHQSDNDDVTDTGEINAAYS